MHRTIVKTVLLLVLIPFFGDVFAIGQLRNVKEGQKMPVFSILAPDGKLFEYTHGQEKVYLIVFLKPDQKNSHLAWSDLQLLAEKLDKNATNVNLFAVIDGEYKAENFPVQGAVEKMNVRFFVDKGHFLWGKVGAIVSPTAIIVDKTDTITCIKSGFGYNFAHTLLLNIQIATGLRDTIDADQKTSVEVLSNKSVADKVQRHLKMAKILQSKGMLESAKEQFDIACQLDPNSTEASLEIAEFYCQTGQYQEALKFAEATKAIQNKDKAIKLLMLARANRGLEKYDIAEQHLVQAAKLESNSPEIYYELGIIYQGQGDMKKAVLVYRQALDILLAGFHENKGLEL